jgi:hypothetical protein
MFPFDISILQVVNQSETADVLWILFVLRITCEAMK